MLLHLLLHATENSPLIYNQTELSKLLIQLLHGQMEFYRTKFQGPLVTKKVSDDEFDAPNLEDGVSFDDKSDLISINLDDLYDKTMDSSFITSIRIILKCLSLVSEKLILSDNSAYMHSLFLIVQSLTSEDFELLPCIFPQLVELLQSSRHMLNEGFLIFKKYNF